MTFLRWWMTTRTTTTFLPSLTILILMTEREGTAAKVPLNSCRGLIPVSEDTMSLFGKGLIAGSMMFGPVWNCSPVPSSLLRNLNRSMLGIIQRIDSSSSLWTASSHTCYLQMRIPDLIMGPVPIGVRA